MKNAIENNTVQINITHNYYNCECCGGIQHSQLELFFSHGLYLHGHYDGHLGYSTWEGQISTAYIWLLETLGICVIFDGKLIHEPFYEGYDEFDDPIVKPLFMGPLRPLYINKTIETIHVNEERSYCYCIDKEVTFSLHEGDTYTYYNENGIAEEQWNEFYSKILSPYYSINVNEKDEYNEVEEDEEDYDYEGDIDIED